MQSSRPYLIGIAGGTASGKTTLCKEIIKQLNMVGDFTLMTMDNFYRDLTEEEMANVSNYNFDAPASLDFDEMYEALQQLLQYKDAEIPDYDFATNSRKKTKITLKSSHFILFEGILALYDPRI
jgi:uridine kinase